MAAGVCRIAPVERIRVLRVITRLNVGGPAIHVSLLTSRLDPERFESLLVAGREGEREGSMLELGRLPDIRPLRVATLGREVSPLDDVRALVSLTRIARSYRPHIVHTHLAKAGFVGRVAATLTRARVVLHTYHGSVLRGYFGARESAAYLAIERALARVSTRLIAVSPQGRRELVELGVAPADRVVEIALGLELDAFRVPVERLAARQALGLLPSAPVIGIIARLVPIKDVGTFLRAVAQLRAAHPGLVAIVVGDGEERETLESLAADLGIGPVCRFLGWRSDIPGILAALDVLALCSLNEGSPVSIIEGMASGAAVVATAVGGVPDVVRDGDNGLLVPARRPDLLARAIGHLLQDGALRRRLGQNAASSVYPAFDASRLIGDVERLYLELLAAS